MATFPVVELTVGSVKRLVRIGKTARELSACVHGRAAPRCDDCGRFFCACPGTLPHCCEHKETGVREAAQPGQVRS